MVSGTDEDLERSLEVSDEESLFDKLADYIAQTAATLVGIVLVAIGISGRLELPLYPIDRISFLAQPMPVADAINHYYWTVLALVGLWLILFILPRLAAGVAIGLIAVKWVVLQGYFVNSL